MKKLFTTLLSLAIIPFAGFGATHVVQVSSNLFTPNNFNAQCGDTVMWQWVAGTHTTTSTNIPACASNGFEWDVPMNASNTIFLYIIPCDGVYNYKCSLHSNMLGSFTVSCNAGVGDHGNGNELSLFPNPFSSTIKFVQPGLAGQDVDIQLSNLLGSVVREYSVKNYSGEAVRFDDLDRLPRGLYFFRYSVDGRPVTRKLMHD